MFLYIKILSFVAMFTQLSINSFISSYILFIIYFNFNVFIYIGILFGYGYALALILLIFSSYSSVFATGQYEEATQLFAISACRKLLAPYRAKH